jgi:hypothetical protein
MKDVCSSIIGEMKLALHVAGLPRKWKKGLKRGESCILSFVYIVSSSNPPPDNQ